ncbi:BQ5605_C017g08544 [Microbotryum silenes-dioicae]|uniref:BQ5605_C017g08544 protein n=1 Tax=Microbotryum silenes-dioicae TaxID=796604 RepID=A0A2X0LZM9_9BASI|nr:BQ5605_C017g08544 [Microbotryum silenes-dioicae]
MLRQGRISSSFDRFVQETALLQMPFNILLQYRCALQKQDTHLLVPGVAIRISTTCRVQTCDLNSSGELSPVRSLPAVRALKVVPSKLKDPVCFGYFDAFTIDSAHSRRTLGDLIPAVNQRPTFAKTWLICPAEATDIQLGPEGADSRIQGSTLTKLDSTLRTGNRLLAEIDAPTTFLRRAPKWGCLSAIPGRSWTQDLILQVHGDRCPEGRPKYPIVSSLHPSAMPLRYPLLFPAEEDSFHLNIPLCAFNQIGPLFAKRPRRGGRGRREWGSRWRVSRSQLFAYYLHKRDEYFSIPHCTQRAFLAFVMTDTPRSRPIDSTYLQLDQKNLRLTTSQGIISLTPNQVGCSVILGSTFKNRPRESTQRYQDAMACVVKHGMPSLFIMVTCNPEWLEIKAALGPNDQACDRPELIARAFEAKLNRLCDDDRFGNKQRAGCL